MPEETEQILHQAWQEGAARANAGYVRRRITIDPVTRLDFAGHCVFSSLPAPTY